MLGHEDATYAYTQRRGYFLRGPLFDHVKIENLVLLSVNLGLHALERRLKEVLLPFFIPNPFQVESGWIRDSLNGRSPGPGSGSTMLAENPRLPLSFAKLVLNFPIRR